MKAVKLAGRDAGEKVEIEKIEGDYAICKCRKKTRKIKLKHLEILG
jgi:hypothetical protein